jgi:hypothetical protein
LEFKEVDKISNDLIEENYRIFLELQSAKQTIDFEGFFCFWLFFVFSLWKSNNMTLILIIFTVDMFPGLRFMSFAVLEERRYVICRPGGEKKNPCVALEIGIITFERQVIPAYYQVGEFMEYFKRKCNNEFMVCKCINYPLILLP